MRAGAWLPEPPPVMVTRQDFVDAFQDLGLPPGRPVIVHASLSAFGRVEGGAQAVAAALLDAYLALVAPAFTYKTMLTPEIGPANNGMTYGLQPDNNLMAQFYHADMPVDRLIGAIPEALRCLPRAQRSMHPIQSFTGMNAAPFLEAQSLEEPLAPLRLLAEAEGWVLLLGVDHTTNTSIHYGERLAGRKQFVRWALTQQGVVACPGFPGCSDGFQALAPRLESSTRRVLVGPGMIQAVPLRKVVEIARQAVTTDPLALLCDRPFCERCYDVRSQVNGSHPGVAG